MIATSHDLSLLGNVPINWATGLLFHSATRLLLNTYILITFTLISRPLGNSVTYSL